jgi:hypothetical protein
VRFKAKRSPGEPSSGGSKRLRLTILLATVAALLLVPAAQALAAGQAHVTIAGSGSGEISSEGGLHEETTFEGVPPIECAYASPGPTTGTCTTTMGGTGSEEEELIELFYEKKGIFLYAYPATGSVFAGWTIEEGEISSLSHTGECEGTDPECVVAASIPEGKDAKAKAVFCLEGQSEAECLSSPPAGPKLTLNIEEGSGTVVSNPAGIECTGSSPHSCSTESIETGKTVTLTASPATGYAFSSWSGCATHVGLTCTVSLTAAKTVKVKFLPTPSMTVEKAGTGAGKVSATGIACDENCSKASSAIKTGASVTVKVTPAKGSEAAIFESGTGSASGCSGATCSFTITANSSVKVKFNPIPTKTMTVNLTGPAAYKGKVSGKGIVKGLLGSAVSCGSGCTTQTESFFSTDEVTLSAVAGTGYSFGGWSVSGGSAGTCTGTTTPCTVKTDANKTISAEFK